MIEAMAQVGGSCSFPKARPPGDGQVPFLTGVDKVRFRRPVVPGDQMRIEVTVLRLRGISAK